MQALAKELVATQPEVIFALGRPAAALQNETHTIPIVFTYVIDPIGAGFIVSLARPGSNLTGIMAYEPTVVGKWCGCSRSLHHRLHALRFWEIRKLLSITITCCTRPWPPRRRSDRGGPQPLENDAADIERVIAAVAGMPNSAMVVLPESTTTFNSNLIIALAARYRLPAVYNLSPGPRGGLMSYGIVAADHYRQAALYVDRILRGAKPGDLPVQTPTKYETALNRKTAKALGLTPPASLTVAADEVIE